MAGLTGKVALITGSSSGIGAATAVLFAKHGCAVSLSGRNEERLQQVRADCISAGLPANKVTYTIGDITSDSTQTALVENTLNKLGEIDILVNNAGQGGADGEGMGCSVASSMAIYDRIMDVNLRSVVSLTKHCLPHLEKTKGAVVNVSSIGGIRAAPPFTYYCMAKAGVDHFTRCLAADVGSKGIRVNSVNPGYIKTNFAKAAGAPDAMISQLETMMLKRYPLGRLGEAEDVAKLILYLSSDDSSFTTGQLHVVDGGTLVSYRTD